MKRLKIGKATENITSNSGLALLGQAIKNHTNLTQSLDNIPLRHGLSHSDVVVSYLGLLSLGKNDFEAIRGMQDDAFYHESLSITQVPSTDRIRQRIDERSKEYESLVSQASIDFLISTGATITGLSTGHVSIDMDVTALDNSSSEKEGVSYTYKKYDGYAPMAAYVGQEGYCVSFELREGKQHCQEGTPELLPIVLDRTFSLTDAKVLLRLDSGNDAIENIQVINDYQAQHPDRKIDFIIKWNPRNEKHHTDDWLALAEKEAAWDEPRAGKRVGVWIMTVTRFWNGKEYTLKRVMRLIERTIDRDGQRLVLPEIEIEGWWFSVNESAETVIALYNDHGTSEQFHSEFKTDLDIERLPSGKFDTNAFVLTSAALIYNILRWLGQEGLTASTKRYKKPAQRRRIKTVMQELMYLAGRIVDSGRYWIMRFSRSCWIAEIFSKLYGKLAGT